jgi:AraC-like DNA-binding protein
MIYQEFAPRPALRAHVACLWTSRVHGLPAPATHRVLPDNCVDILWQDSGAPGFVVGMMRRAIQVSTSGTVQTVAVRFKPGAAGAFLGLPLHELTDQRADIDLLWQRDETDRLAERLWSRPLPDRARLAILEQHLIDRLQRRSASAAAAPGARLVQAALAGLDASAGQLRIDDLAERLGVSRQHLAAQFRDRVGLTPKLYARIQRFRRATDALRAATAPDWPQLALECGYFDQSHLINDFQEFAGSAPLSFVASR